MKLFHKIAKHSRAYRIGESLAYAKGVPMAHLWRVDVVLLHETILGLMLYDGCRDDQEDMDMTRMATEHWLPTIRSLM